MTLKPVLRKKCSKFVIDLELRRLYMVEPVFSWVIHSWEILNAIKNQKLNIDGGIVKGSLNTVNNIIRLERRTLPLRFIQYLRKLILKSLLTAIPDWYFPTLITPVSFTHLFPMHLFSTPWKHQKTLWFSDVLRRYRNVALVTNEF